MAEQTNTEAAWEVFINFYLMILTIAGLGLSRIYSTRWVQRQPGTYIPSRPRSAVERSRVILHSPEITFLRISPFTTTGLVWCSTIDTVVVYCAVLISFGVLRTFVAWETTVRIAAQCGFLLGFFGFGQVVMALGWRILARRRQRASATEMDV
nr:hypothetical protein B0A51_02499 [Rachicladosporium sp. CCFEE 5018]